MYIDLHKKKKRIQLVTHYDSTQDKESGPQRNDKQK